MVDDTGDALAATEDDGVALEPGFANDDVTEQPSVLPEGEEQPSVLPEGEESDFDPSVVIRLVIFATVMFFILKPSPTSQSKKTA